MYIHVKYNAITATFVSMTRKKQQNFVWNLYYHTPYLTHTAHSDNCRPLSNNCATGESSNEVPSLGSLSVWADHFSLY